MRRFRARSADEVIANDEELNASSAFAEDLRTAFPEPCVDDSVKQAHFAAMAEAADSVLGASRQASRPPIPRRSPVFKSLAAKITAVAVVLFASLGGLATAGALPRPVQHGVARVADTVGINLPDPDEQENQTGDQGTSGDTNDQSGDQGTSGDTNDQSGDQSGPNDQSGDQGTSGDSNDQSGDQGGS